MPLSVLRPCNLPVRVFWVDYSVQCFLDMLMVKNTACTTFYTTFHRMTEPLMWPLPSWFADGCLCICISQPAFYFQSLLPSS